MIGYYLHHVGQGHLHRALAVVPHLPLPVTVLSSLPPDDRWPGAWLRLPRDDEAATTDRPTAGGYLHWAPLHDAGLRRRMRLIADWIDTHRPRVMVVDLSVEVLVLCRLMGVPAVAVTLPGVRDDPAHHRGYELADAIVAPWPARFRNLGPSLHRYGGKVSYVGGVSRYEGRSQPFRRDDPTRASGRRVLALAGTGTAGPARNKGFATTEVAGWNWSSIGPENWNPDPWDDLCTADLVVTHAGLGALSDVATARRPAVVIPQERPHLEQVTTAAALADAGLAVVVRDMPTRPAEWPELFDHAVRLGGEGWQVWADGDGGRRMADVVTQVARQAP